MNKTLHAEETPLSEVFSDAFAFSIPSVQRPYSWTSDEAGDLLDDLLDYIEHKSITEKNINQIKEPYFLGSIVLVKKEMNEFEVLDGQQRLTTLTILLAALRDYLGGDLGNDIHAMIRQKGNQLLQRKIQYRMELRKRDQLFFQNNVQEWEAATKVNEHTLVKTDSQKCIRDNLLYFIERLNTLDPAIVRTLPKVIAGLCYLVVVSTPTFDSAFRIFTVLNDRGLDLMHSDIFKARVIEDVPEEEQSEYTRKWEDAEIALGRDRFNKLFEHIRMILQKRKGGANIKDEYDDIFNKIVSGKDFIDTILIPYSDTYLKLVDYQTHYKENPQMIKLLSIMNRIDNVDWVTAAMYYIQNYVGQQEEFLQRLEAFAATSMILRRNYNWRMSKYSQMLREMEKGINVFSKESTLELSDEDCSLVIDKLNGDVYLDLKDTAKRYVLLRLDSLLTTGQPFYNHSIVTVEHVLPQTPASDSKWLENFDEPGAFVHKLGNLVLLTRRKNSKAKNFDFQKKKSSYFQSASGVTSFALTTEVVQFNEWTPVIIKKRQEKLIKLLVHAWNLKA